MGFIESIVSAFQDASTDIVKLIMETIVLGPLQQFIGGLMAFLQNILIGTPYPKQGNGQIPAITGEPSGELWAALYSFHNDIFQPLAYFILFMTILAIIFFDLFESMVPDDAPFGQKINQQLENAKGKMFIGFLMVTFWWYLGTLVLAMSDALANLLVGVVEGENGSTGLEAMWDMTMEYINSDAGSSGFVLILPLTILWLAESIILLVIALVWVIRWFAIYLMMPIMPVMISIWVLEIPGVDRLQDVGEEALGWFMSLAFITLPAALVIGVSGQVVSTLLSTASDMHPSSDESFNQPDPQAVSGYDTQSVISHPTVGGEIYGDGVAGLGSVGQPSIQDSVGSFFMMLMAILMVAAVPLLAGLAPFWLYKEETALAARAAAGDPTAMSDAINHFGQEERFDNLQDTIKGTRNTLDAKRGNYDAIADRHDMDLDEVNRDNVMNQLWQQEGSRAAMGAGFAGRASDAATATQQTASQIKSGAATARDGAVRGAVRMDNAQRMIREHRGELADIGMSNARSTAMNTIDPVKQKARMQSIAGSASSIKDKPSEVRESFANSVAEQKNSIDERLENRRVRHQRIADMSEGELRKEYQKKGYIPGEGDLNSYLSSTSKAASRSEVQQFGSNLNDLSNYGRSNPEKAIEALDAAEQEVAGMDGLSTEDREVYRQEIDTLQEMVRSGELSPSEAMQALDGMNRTIQDDITTEDELRAKFEDREEQYEKYGANYEEDGQRSDHKARAAHQTRHEVSQMPVLEEVLAGDYVIDDNELEQAFEEKGKSLEQFVYNSDEYESVQDLKADESELRGILGPEKVNDLKRGDYTVRDNRVEKAFEEAGVDMEEFIEKNDKIDDVEDMNLYPEEIANAVGTQTFNQLEVADKFEAKAGVNEEAAKEYLGYDDETLQSIDSATLLNNMEKELQNDLDTGKVTEAIQELTDDDTQVDRTMFSAKDRDTAADEVISHLGKVQDSDDVDTSEAIKSLTEDLEIDVGVDTETLVEEGINNLDEETVNTVKNNIKKSLESETVLSQEETQDVMQELSDAKMEAQGQYAAEVLSDALGEAASTEAAIEVMEQNAGEIARLSGEQRVETEVDDERREEIVGELVEQAMSGEEVQSDIAQQFHEEFESTQDMLDNMGAIQETRDIVNEFEDELENMATDVQIGDTSLSELESGEKDATEALSEIADVDISAIQSKELDAETIDEHFEIDISETERELADDTTELVYEKAEEQARDKVADKIQGEFGEEALKDAGFTTDPDEAADNDELEALDFENAEQAIKKAGREKKKKEILEKRKSD